MWSNYYTCTEGIVKDAAQRIAVSLTCDEILNDISRRIPDLATKHGYRHFVLRFNGSERPDFMIKCSSLMSSHLSAVDCGTVTVVFNLLEDDGVPAYVDEILTILRHLCTCVMVQYSNQDYPHRMLRQCSHMNEIIERINSETRQLRAQQPPEELQPGRVNLATNQIKLGFTCSDISSERDPAAAALPMATGGSSSSGGTAGGGSSGSMMMNQRNVERLLDTLENSYTKPVSVSLIQLPQRSGASKATRVATVDPATGVSEAGSSSSNGNVCASGLVPLPNLSTRMMDFNHSRSINCLVELQTVDRYMRLFEAEHARLTELDRMHAEMERRNVRKKSIAERIGVAGNEAASLFNLQAFLQPFGTKYKKHVFLILIMCYVQLGAVVSIPFSCMWETTQVPKVVKPELPPMTPQPINPALISKKKKKLIDAAAANAGESADTAGAEMKSGTFVTGESSEHGESAHVEMEDITYAALVATILHPFVYRKEYMAPTFVIKFIITPEDMDVLVETSLAIEALQDDDEYFHQLGNTQPQLRELKY